MPERRREAVALRYDSEREDAPRVIAKGKGTIAEQLLRLAEEYGIPLHEDENLVQLLGVLELDVEIPPRLYAALAEVLAHVYRINASAQRPKR